jgi:sulfate permease, SulP family
VLDCSGINDIDATGADTLSEIIAEIDESPVTLHLADVKGPVRDVLRRAGLWDRLDGRIHATPHQAVPPSRAARNARLPARRGHRRARRRASVSASPAPNPAGRSHV